MNSIQFCTIGGHSFLFFPFSLKRFFFYRQLSCLASDIFKPFPGLPDFLRLFINSQPFTGARRTCIVQPDPHPSPCPWSSHLPSLPFRRLTPTPPPPSRRWQTLGGRVRETRLWCKAVAKMKLSVVMARRTVLDAVPTMFVVWKWR